MDKLESGLILIAENDPCDKKAKQSMKELREKFDKTYMWCLDCDGLVVKEKDCCLNRISEDNGGVEF